MNPIAGCGHRGNGIDRPEQTLAAYRRAVELGATFIEFDVRVTKDNQLVVFHDATLERTTNGTGRVIDHTVSELRDLDAGAWFASEFAGERVPMLEDLLAFLQDASVIGCVEVKAESADEAARTALLLAEWLEEHDCNGLMRVSSFHLDALATVAAKAPSLRQLPWMDEFSPANVPSHLQDASRLQALGVFHTAALLSRAQVAELQASGLEVWVWSADDEASLAQAVSLVPDVISCSNIGGLMTLVGGDDQ